MTYHTMLTMLRSLKSELELLHLSMVAQAEALATRLDHLEQYIEDAQAELDRASATANEIRARYE